MIFWVKNRIKSGSQLKDKLVFQSIFKFASGFLKIIHTESNKIIKYFRNQPGKTDHFSTKMSKSLGIVQLN